MTDPTILQHPLIKHKISILRNIDTDTPNFRKLVEEIAVLISYEALRDLPTENVKINTPVSEAHVPVLGTKITVVPILRAGLGMLGGVLSLIPSAKVGHLGLARDEQTHEPYEYYCKLPEDIADTQPLIIDPMLATGGSAIHAVDILKRAGCKNIRFLCIIAAPEGLDALREAHPDIQIYVGCLDEKLNDNAYIVPGLGDAGDRIFGTM